MDTAEHEDNDDDTVETIDAVETDNTYEDDEICDFDDMDVDVVVVAVDVE